MQHFTVYREPGRFAGWPANYGLWNWGDEIVVGFVAGYHRAGEGFHAIDNHRSMMTMQARSRDGGETWEAQPFHGRTPGSRALSADEHTDYEHAIGIPDWHDDAPAPHPGGIDFTHPDFALMAARTGLEAGAVSWFYTSTDRCETWDGPFSLPTFGQKGVAARTDYLPLSPRECLLFLTATKPDGREGRVFCARTGDGGASFEFVSWVGPENPPGYAIMPSSVRLPDGRIITALRMVEGSRAWIDVYASDDNGMKWQFLERPTINTGRGGNPPALIRLRDGRLCLVYGYRAPPYGLRACFSEDGGQTWGGEIILRGDGGTHDLGYPRVAQRADGALVIVYYYADYPASERYIAATVWRP